MLFEFLLLYCLTIQSISQHNVYTREPLLADLEKYTDPEKRACYVRRCRLDYTLFQTSQGLGPERAEAIYNLLTATADGQHRAIAAYRALFGFPVHDVKYRPINQAMPNLRKQMDVYCNPGTPLTSESQILSPTPVRVVKHTPDANIDGHATKPIKKREAPRAASNKM